MNAMSWENILRQYLDTMKGQYSHILIDCQPSLPSPAAENVQSGRPPDPGHDGVIMDEEKKSDLDKITFTSDTLQARLRPDKLE